MLKLSLPIVKDKNKEGEKRRSRVKTLIECLSQGYTSQDRKAKEVTCAIPQLHENLCTLKLQAKDFPINHHFCILSTILKCSCKIGNPFTGDYPAFSG